MDRKVRKRYLKNRKWISLLCILSLLLPGITAKGFSGPYMTYECLTFGHWLWENHVVLTGYDAGENNVHKQLAVASSFIESSTGKKFLVTRIANSVFYGETFSQIYMETDNGLEIGQQAFQNVKVQEVEGSSVKEHTVEFKGDSLKSIEAYAFMGMSTNGDFTINKMQGSIETGAFQDASIGGKFLIQGEIDTIGKDAFAGFSSNGFNIAATVKRFGKGAFKRTKWEKFTIGDSVQYLESALFEDSALKRLTIPASDSMKEVAEDAFPDREDLTIVIPAEDIDLSVYHFDKYKNVLFETVEDIAEDSPVLEYLKEHNLRYRMGESGETVEPSESTPTPDMGEESTPTATASATASPTPSIEEESTPTPTASATPTASTTPSPTSSPTLTPSASPDVNRNTTPTPGNVTQNPTPPQVTPSVTPGTSGKKDFTRKKINYRITGKNQVGVTGTADKKIAKIKIPDTVTYQGRLYKITSIEKKAFKNLSKCKQVSIGDYVKVIGDQAFCRCKNLRRISFGRGLKKIGKKVLYQDKKIKKIIFLGDKLKKIGQKTFRGVDKKVGITAPKKKAARYKKMIQRST